MSETTICKAGDLRVGDRLVAVNGHPAPGGLPVEVLDVGWSLVNNVLDLTLLHGADTVHQQLHVEEMVEAQR
ncbi:hypothetical protein EV383_4447 [Pseudonocardia sediminis]|uniref:PDZ domain-containing protein n=1 Tax=Pseudonocardia sediminis TaxID=1397368 RepID=A0A4Q7UZF4_PSEST|nr:hypothetical protein [Pseudonocardia sediminis]RZT87522.1 hypothetical protein EV383_4447 [Pseudonocardia sediminis]